MNDLGFARAFASMQRLLLVVDPGFGESQWQVAHSFAMLPSAQRVAGHWYQQANDSGFFHVDEKLNGQWHKELPAGINAADIIQIPPAHVASLFETMQSIVARLDLGETTRDKLEQLVANLTATIGPDHKLSQVRELRQAVFSSVLAGKDHLLEYLDKSAQDYCCDALVSGKVSGLEAAAMLLIRELSRALSTHLTADATDRKEKASRVLNMLGAPGGTSLEMVAGQFVRDCLQYGFTQETMEALQQLQKEGNDAVESAREGFYPVGHPERMFDLYYLGIFLAVPKLRATMVGYEVLSAKPGLNDQERKRYLTWANAAEEKLVRISDAMLFAIRDLNGDESRQKQCEIRSLISAGDEKRAKEFVMELVDIKLFFPKPFKQVLLAPEANR